MKPIMVERAVKETRAQRVDPRAVRTFPLVFVAELKCRRMRPRCTYATVGFRRPEEWVDWRAARCEKCGVRGMHLVREVYAELEVNAPIQVLRYRQVDVETGQPTDPARDAWRYLPFALAGQVLEGLDEPLTGKTALPQP